jgi:molybdate transport system ATP-binding protein
MEVELALKKGSILALTGPSGAGKTTLLKQIAGLLTPNEGNISCGNQVWLNTGQGLKVPPQNRNIGFVFQDYALFPNMTVLQNFKYALPKKASSEIIDELLEGTELTMLADRKPDQLSGGQQQRVALARALVRKPGLLLLDEPFSAVDTAMRNQLQELILKFHTEYHFTAILVTHETGEIFRLADQVCALENGKVAKFGTPAEVYLNKSEVNEELLIYGEVLSFETIENEVFMNALVDRKVRKIKLPAGSEKLLVPGKRFVLNYSPDFPKISWLA